MSLQRRFLPNGFRTVFGGNLEIEFYMSAKSHEGIKSCSIWRYLQYE